MLASPNLTYDRRTGEHLSLQLGENLLARAQSVSHEMRCLGILIDGLRRSCTLEQALLVTTTVAGFVAWECTLQRLSTQKIAQTWVGKHSYSVSLTTEGARNLNSLDGTCSGHGL